MAGWFHFLTQIKFMLLRLQIPGSSDKRVLSMDVLKVAYICFVLKFVCLYYVLKIGVIQLLVQFLKVDNRRQAGWE